MLTLWFEHTADLMEGAGIGSSSQYGSSTPGSQFSPQGSSLSRRGSRGASVQAMGVSGGKKRQDSSGGLHVGGVEEKTLQQLFIVMKRAIKRINTYQWYTALPQLASRICHPNPEVVGIVQAVLRNVVTDFPGQAAWTLAGPFPILPSSLLVLLHSAFPPSHTSLSPSPPPPLTPPYLSHLFGRSQGSATR
jgi:hypothetical protein